MKSLILFCLAGLLSTATLAQQSAYKYTAPSSWTAAIESGSETLTPTKEPSGTALIVLLAPKPLSGPFDAQFTKELRELEAGWGLTLPIAVPVQRGVTAEGPYSAHFASYVAEGAARYMSFLAIGRTGKFSMLVFVASTPDTFNRVAPLVTQMWQSLQISP
jgi:hypothetical protein